jgi:hypothetical protein
VKIDESVILLATELPDEPEKIEEALVRRHADDAAQARVSFDQPSVWLFGDVGEGSTRERLFKGRDCRRRHDHVADAAEPDEKDSL